MSDAIAGGNNVPVALAEMSGIVLMLAFCVALLVLPIVAGAFAPWYSPIAMLGKALRGSS